MSHGSDLSGPQFRADRPAECEAVRTTIVGGRPPGSGQPVGNIPRGIEVLVKKAAVDPAFKALLLERRAAAAETIGLALEPAEALMLAAVPAAQLEAIVARTAVPEDHRRAFLGYAAAAMLAALGTMGPVACMAKMPAPGGARPPERPQKPQPVSDRVFGIIARRLAVDGHKVLRDTPLDAPADTEAEKAAQQQRREGIRDDLQKEFRLTLPADDVKRWKTAGDALDSVEKALKAPPKPPSPPVSRGIRPDRPQ